MKLKGYSNQDMIDYLKDHNIKQPKAVTLPMQHSSDVS